MNYVNYYFNTYHEKLDTQQTEHLAPDFACIFLY